MLDIENLFVEIDSKSVIKDLNFSMQANEIQVLMGPNGSGKSSLCYTIMGHPSYKVKSGKILCNGEDITNLTPEKRSGLDIFLGFQNPVEIPGMTFGNYLRNIERNKLKLKGASEEEIKALDDIRGYMKKIGTVMEEVGLNKDFLGRGINEGFSGGEKKKSELLQMFVLKPKLVILDELDSGMDLDSIKLVIRFLRKFQKTQKTALLFITHNGKHLKDFAVNKVNVLSEGKIIRQGDKGLIDEIHKVGFGN